MYVVVFICHRWVQSLHTFNVTTYTEIVSKASSKMSWGRTKRKIQWVSKESRTLNIKEKCLCFYMYICIQGLIEEGGGQETTFDEISQNYSNKLSGVPFKEAKELKVRAIHIFTFK